MIKRYNMDISTIIDEITSVESPTGEWVAYSDVVKLEEEIVRLQKEVDKLYALEAAGVDNWQGYDDAMDILHEWELEDNN